MNLPGCSSPWSRSRTATFNLAAIISSAYCISPLIVATGYFLALEADGICSFFGLYDFPKTALTTYNGNAAWHPDDEKQYQQLTPRGGTFMPRNA